MTGGCSNREIAEALNISEGTVKNHVSNILSKLGVRDRTRAVLKATKEGYLWLSLHICVCVKPGERTQRFSICIAASCLLLARRLTWPALETLSG